MLIYVCIRIVQVQAGYSPPEEKTEVWFGNVARFREILYAKIADPSRHTIYVVSGSNGLFGIHSPEIEKRTGYNVRNYALHGGLHYDLLFSQITDKVWPGDIVVAPIEWEVRDRPFGNQFDYSNYLRHFSRSVHLPAMDVFTLYTSVPLIRWWHGLISYVYGPSDARDVWSFYPDEGLLAQYDARNGTENYSHLGLTAHGDFLFDLPMSSATWESGATFMVPSTVSDATLARMDWWTAFFAGKGAKLMVVPPVMLEAKVPTLTSPETWANVEAIRQRMSTSASPLYCDPLSFVFSRRYRFDTSYHMNAPGAKLRSIQLADCILGSLNGRDMRTKPVDAASSVKIAQDRLAQQQ